MATPRRARRRSAFERTLRLATNFFHSAHDEARVTTLYPRCVIGLAWFVSGCLARLFPGSATPHNKADGWNFSESLVRRKGKTVKLQGRAEELQKDVRVLPPKLEVRGGT